MYLQYNYENCVIKYDQTYSPYPVKISIIYLMTLPMIPSHVSTAFLIKALIDELTIESLKKQMNVFLTVCKTLTQIS